MTIGLHRSRFLERVLIVLMLSAAAAILVFPVQPALQGIVLLVIGALSLWSWRHLAPTLSAIRLERDGNVLAAVMGDEELSESTLLQGATVHPWLTVLRLELADGRKHTVVLSRDSMASDDFRRLRVFLRWRAQFSAVGDGRGEPCS